MTAASPTIIEGDCLTAMAAMDAGSIDAIVTDPPYGLKFMGKAWDHGVPGVPFWDAALRVAKPGSYLLAFGGTRTFHRLTCAIEDAGWEVQDCLMWLYGSGFPKHKSKLKPAWEPIIMARKPAARATQLNVDACRIGATDTRRTKRGGCNDFPHEDDSWTPRSVSVGSASGRWPANVVLDEEAALALDEQSGTNCGAAGRASGPTHSGYNKSGSMAGHRNGMGDRVPAFYADTGGASRFYYVAKASRAEREAGLIDAPRRNGGSNAKGFTEDVAQGQDRNRPVANHHPTVKPIALMRWLVRLVTPPGGLVLDPFAGSGTTGCAAVLEGRRFVGCEISPEYLPIAHARIADALGSSPPAPEGKPLLNHAFRAAIRGLHSPPPATGAPE